MRITPLDVRKQEFRKGMRGLDTEEVYAFLGTVADEYEAVLNDNKALRERLLELDDKVQEYRTMEKTLRNTLLTAERVTVEAKDNARREATLIVKEAQMEAEKALRDIKNEEMRLRQQVQQLRSQREAYLARMKVVAESHLNFIDSASDDFENQDDAAKAAPRRSTASAEASAQRARDAVHAATSRSAHQSPAPDPVLEHPRDAAPARPAPVSEQFAPAPKPAQASPPPAAPWNPGNAPAPAPAPDSGRTNAVLDTDRDIESMADLSAILERMRQGQQEMLRASSEMELEYDSHTATATEEAPRMTDPPFARRSMADTSTHSWDRAEAPADEPPPHRAAPAPAREQPRHAAPAPVAPAGNDVTSEWDISQIRRDLLRHGQRDED